MLMPLGIMLFMPPPPPMDFIAFSMAAFICGFCSIIFFICGSFILACISFICSCVFGSAICFSAWAIWAFVSGSVISMFIDQRMVPSNVCALRPAGAMRTNSISILFIGVRAGGLKESGFE